MVAVDRTREFRDLLPLLRQHAAAAAGDPGRDDEPLGKFDAVADFILPKVAPKTKFTDTALGLVRGLKLVLRIPSRT